MRHYLLTYFQKKVEKYWPDINETDTYGNVSVTYSEITVFAEYNSKVFIVKCGNEKRRVIHLHFTCWPDHGVPFYPQSLAPFLKRTITISQTKAPTIVHCRYRVGESYSQTIRARVKIERKRPIFFYSFGKTRISFGEVFLQTYAKSKNTRNFEACFCKLYMIVINIHLLTAQVLVELVRLFYPIFAYEWLQKVEKLMCITIYFGCENKESIWLIILISIS